MISFMINKYSYSEYILSTIFLTAPNTHDNIANIVMKSSWEAVKTLQLNSHETSLNS